MKRNRVVCFEGFALTAVELVGVGVLGSLLLSSICVGVSDLGELAELGGAEHVSSVDEEGGSSSCEDVAVEARLVSELSQRGHLSQ